VRQSELAHLSRVDGGVSILLVAFIGLIEILASADSQRPAPPAPEPGFFAVAYVEVAPSFRKEALAAFKECRDASRMQEGSVRFDLFEQIGRPGHFAVVEAWRDQSVFDTSRSSVGRRLLDRLHPVRVSGFDQRPYKPITVGSGSAAVKGAVSVVTHVDVSPDPRVADMLKRLAESSRHDAGNVRFDVLQHAVRGNHFTVVETWRNQKALDDHAAAAHTKRYRDDLQPLTGSPLDERVYRQLP
jgi:quinol monooxygenase YgiN